MVSIKDSKEIEDTIQAVNKLTRALRTATDKNPIIKELNAAAEKLERLTERYARVNKQELKELFRTLDDTLKFYDAKLSSLDSPIYASSSVSDSEVDKIIAEVTADVANKKGSNPRSVMNTQYRPTQANARNLNTVEDLAMELYYLGEQINNLPDDLTPKPATTTNSAVDPYENLYEEIRALPDDKPSPVLSIPTVTPLAPMTTSTASSMKSVMSKVYQGTKSLTENVVVPVLQETVRLIKKALSSLWESLIVKKLIPMVKDQISKKNKDPAQMRTAIQALDTSVNLAKKLMEKVRLQSSRSISNNGYKNKYQAIQETAKPKTVNSTSKLDGSPRPKGP